MLDLQIIPRGRLALASIELIHLIHKGQFTIDGADAMSFADQFSTLAGMVRLE